MNIVPEYKWPFGIQIRIIDIKMVSFIKVTRCFHMNFIFFYKTIKEWKIMHRVYLNNVAWSMFPKHQKTYYVEIWFIFLKIGIIFLLIINKKVDIEVCSRHDAINWSNKIILKNNWIIIKKNHYYISVFILYVMKYFTIWKVWYAVGVPFNLKCRVHNIWEK
jgi:hypothetical protein